MARPLKPLVRSGGFYPSKRWTPLVYSGGYTTMNGGEEPVPPAPINWKTVTGVSPLALVNSLANSIKSLTQYGKCVQIGTPTLDAPAPIMCNNGELKISLNMADVNKQTALVGYYVSAQGVVTADANNWIYQEYIPCKPSTTYTLSMSAPVYYVSISEYSTADDSGFIIRKAGSTGGNTVLTITTGDTTNYIRFGANLDRAEVTLERVLAINWMLNKGSVAVPYTPYVEGGIYTDGTPEVLSVYRQDSYTAVDGSGTYASPSGIVTTRIYKALGVHDGDYTISVPDTYDFIVQYKNADASDRGNVGDWTNGKETVTLDKGAGYTYGLAIRSHSAPSANINPNSFSGTISVKHETTAQTASAENLLSTGQFSDTQEIIGGLKTPKVRAVVFDGTEDFKSSSSNPYKIYLQVPRDGRQMFTNIKVFCSHFKPAETATWGGLQPGECLFEGNDGGNYSFDFYTADLAAAGFKAKLAELYAAGTPLFMLIPNWEYWDGGQVPEQVTPQPLHSYKGATVISVESNVDSVALTVEYATSEAPSLGFGLGMGNPNSGDEPEEPEETEGK